MRKNVTKKPVFQPHYLKDEDRWVVGVGGDQPYELVKKEIDRRNQGIRRYNQKIKIWKETK